MTEPADPHPDEEQCCGGSGLQQRRPVPQAPEPSHAIGFREAIAACCGGRRFCRFMPEPIGVEHFIEACPHCCRRRRLARNVTELRPERLDLPYLAAACGAGIDVPLQFPSCRVGQFAG